MKLEEMQLKDTLRMFNGLVERCFNECVVSFRSKVLTAPEEKCVCTCVRSRVPVSGVGTMDHGVYMGAGSLFQCTRVPHSINTQDAPLISTPAPLMITDQPSDVSDLSVPLSHALVFPDPPVSLSSLSLSHSISLSLPPDRHPWHLLGPWRAGLLRAS